MYDLVQLIEALHVVIKETVGKGGSFHDGIVGAGDIGDIGVGSEDVVVDAFDGTYYLLNGCVQLMCKLVDTAHAVHK